MVELGEAEKDLIDVVEREAGIPGQHVLVDIHKVNEEAAVVAEHGQHEALAVGVKGAEQFVARNVDSQAARGIVLVAVADVARLVEEVERTEERCGEVAVGAAEPVDVQLPRHIHSIADGNAEEASEQLIDIADKVERGELLRRATRDALPLLPIGEENGV